MGYQGDHKIGKIRRVNEEEGRGIGKNSKWGTSRSSIEIGEERIFKKVIMGFSINSCSWNYNK